LGTIIAALGCSCKEKITVTVEQLKNPHLIVMSTCLSKLLPPVDIQTPEMFRSEEEQFVRHELIDVPPLPPPPSNRHESSSSFEAIVVHPKEKHSFYRQRKVKSKSRKPGFKVVRDLLTQK
jgi:hypothetical protein